MRCKELIVLIIIFCNVVTFSQTTPAKQKPVSKTQQYIMHVVKPGETLTKISKKYNVSVLAILNINPSLTEDNLMPEQIIRIPNTNNKKDLIDSNSNKNELKPKVKVTTELKPKNAKYHTVEAGETLYSISKKYGVKVEEIQKWNNLSDFNVKLGTQLIVSNKNQELPLKEVEVAKASVKKEEPKVEAPPVIEENVPKEPQDTDIQASDNANQQELSKIFKTKSTTSSIISTKGTGAPMTTTLGAMESVYFAMHKTLPIGTIIKIKNLVNNKIIYAKVIGKLPETDENKHVIVRYSLGVKKDLQLQNGKCYVQVEYPE